MLTLYRLTLTPLPLFLTGVTGQDTKTFCKEHETTKNSCKKN